MWRKRAQQGEIVAAKEHRHLLAVFPLLFAIFLCLAGCNRAADPQKAFDHNRQTFLQGDLLRALGEATGHRQQFDHSNPQWAWRFRLLEAEILVSQGTGKDALAVLETAAPPELAHSDLAIKQKVLQASAYTVVRRLDEAEQSLRAAEAMSVSNPALAGEIARARGVLEGALNHQENAERYFRQSLQIAREQSNDPLELADLLNLSHVALQEEHYDESIDLSNTAIEKARSLGNRRLAEAAMGNLGWAYFKMGDFDRALTLYQEAEQAAENLGAVYHRILWLNNLGLIYQQMNQPAVAENYYQLSLALAQKNAAPQPVIDALTSLAFVSMENGQVASAQQYGERAFQLAHGKNDRTSELPALLVEGEVQAARGNPDQAEKIFREVADEKKSDLSLRWQAQNDLAGLYEQQHRLADADQLYRNALATIEQARASLQLEDFRLPFLANAAHLYDDYVGFLVTEGKSNEALRFADYSRARTLAEGLGVNSGDTKAEALNPEAIARRANATILFYWLGRKQAYLWAITAGGTTLFPLPRTEEIHAAVQRYAKALLGWQDVLGKANPEATYLYSKLIEPARDLIPQNSRVIIIADGILNSLNFETLLAPGPPLHYWIEDATIVSASSLRVLEASQVRRSKSSGKLLLIGNAISAGPEYAELPNAMAEMESVRKHFDEPAAQIYAREKAVPDAYFGANPAQFSFIHFVAHARASKIDPLDSAIMLSPPSAEPDSFKLYARDIKLHPLRADLVTISSCYGAGTKAYTGEGLVGLSWAFLRAGAHNVIGALWDVDDASTANLMDRLYGELKQGRPPDEALRTAKLSLLHSKGIVRKPFYWAPFQLYTGR